MRFASRPIRRCRSGPRTSAATAAGLAFSASQLIVGNRFSAASTMIVFVIADAGQLQLGPFRRAGG